MPKRRAAALVLTLLVVLASSTPSAADDRAVKRSIPGVENAYQLSPRLLSGGKPEGAAAFEALEALGVKTIVSVDGAPTDVEAAQAHGMRYVHLPVGYDGIDPGSAARLVKLMQTLPGPVFVHCHHGKHRGPAAASLCAIATEGWTTAEARAWLKQAGTSTDYQGLYQSVDHFQMPAQNVLDKLNPDPGHDLPAQAQLPVLVELMVEVDAAWDQLKPLTVEAVAKPALTPDEAQAMSATALVLAEHYREAARLPEADRKGPDFLKALADAERRALDLQSRLKATRHNSQPTPDVNAAAKLAGQSCVNCHKQFRD